MRLSPDPLDVVGLPVKLDHDRLPNEVVVRSSQSRINEHGSADQRRPTRPVGEGLDVDYG